MPFNINIPLMCVTRPVTRYGRINSRSYVSAACNLPVNLYLAISARHRRSVRGQVNCAPRMSAQPLDHRARTSHCSRAQTRASARARARTLSARRSLSPAPHSCRSSLSAQRLCAGFHAYPDSLMGTARSRLSILSAHTWARAAFAGTGLPLPACVVLCPRLWAPPPAHCNLSSTRCSAVAPSPAQ